MSTGAKAYLSKLIRMRKYLLREGKSQQDKAKVLRALKTLDGWLKFYKNATDRQVARFIESHQAEVYTIMPGSRCGNFEKLNQELLQIISPHEKN